MNWRVYLLLVSGVLAVSLPATRVHGATVDITLSSNPPTLTTELSEYLASSFAGIHRVGFNGADIGQGVGDGLNELVAFSFTYSPIALPIASATLALDLVKPSEFDTSDHILLADNNTPFANDVANPYYGQPQLGNLNPGIATVISLDLTSIPTNLGFQGTIGNESIVPLLQDGEFNIVYFDDARILSARLVIDVIPEPASSTAAVFITVMSVMRRSRRNVSGFAT